MCVWVCVAGSLVAANVQLSVSSGRLCCVFGRVLLSVWQTCRALLFFPYPLLLVHYFHNLDPLLLVPYFLKQKKESKTLF